MQSLRQAQQGEAEQARHVSAPRRSSDRVGVYHARRKMEIPAIAGIHLLMPPNSSPVKYCNVLYTSVGAPHGDLQLAENWRFL